MKKYNYIDFILSLIIIMALITIPNNKMAWLLYSIGCAGYTVINFKYKLFGQ